MHELTLTLIRGLPGSGKSTLAKQLVESSDNKQAHLEADMYFVNRQGVSQRIMNYRKIFGVEAQLLLSM